MTRGRKIFWYSVVGVILGTSMLCRFLLFQVGFEFDEIFTALTSDPGRSWFWIYKNWLLIDVHPPLHNFILYIWNHVFPYGPEVWLRLPSLFFSLGALVLGWFLFPKRWGINARLIFVTFLATHGYSIIYGQHARPYALMVFLAVPVTFLFLRLSRLIWHRRAISVKQWSWFALSALLLSYTHYFGTLLVGVLFILLFVQAWYYKRRLLPFVVVPGIVFLLFLPFLIPNLWINMGLHRFSGDWWQNTEKWSRVPKDWVFFFMTSYKGALLASILVLSGWVWNYLQYRRTKVFVYGRELCLMAIAVVSVLAGACLLSLKLHLFMGRYFTELLPAFYLIIVLSIAPLLRRGDYKSWALITAVLALALSVYIAEYKVFLNPVRFSARMCSKFWQTNYQNKDLLVASVSGYPPPIMNEMYGFYLNKIWKGHVKVKEIHHLPIKRRDAILAEYPHPLIFVPHCVGGALTEVAGSWKRSIVLVWRFGGSCFITVSKRKEKRSPTEWLNMDAVKKQ